MRSTPIKSTSHEINISHASSHQWCCHARVRVLPICDLDRDDQVVPGYPSCVHLDYILLSVYYNSNYKFTSQLNDIVIAIISSRRYLPICYVLCCRNSISCSHIGYILCGCNLCSISAISIICVHFKVFKCSLLRSRCVQLC